MKQLTLTLIRGLPGSGKSTLAKTIDAYHLETDMYFIDTKGNYKFDATQLKIAHHWCLMQSALQLKQHNNVVVSNTFVRQWEMQSYRLLAKKYNTKLNIIICKGAFISEHNVPQQTLLKMKKQWQE
ncbi:ATPase AAA [Psychromonas sp. PRT-SC03]|nr:ATPase AAA [Psychromonas sp. PRT-SC03]